jgi:hypothetical protein
MAEGPENQVEGFQMTRPTYQTAADKEREDDIAHEACRHLSMHWIGFPPFANFDKLFMVGREPIRWVEIKDRGKGGVIAMRSYPTFMISMKKVKAGLSLQQITKVPAFFGIAWSDAIGLIPVDSPYSIERGGRVDRGDPDDMEGCAYYPIENFKVVCSLEPNQLIGQQRWGGAR